MTIVQGGRMALEWDIQTNKLGWSYGLSVAHFQLTPDRHKWNYLEEYKHLTFSDFVYSPSQRGGRQSRRSSCR